jgi:hypothetical protein
METSNKLRPRWPHLLFWVSFGFTALGFFCVAAAVFALAESMTGSQL